MSPSSASLTSASLFQITAALIIALQSAGCGILIGNVKPITGKSESYRILDLAKSEDWEAIDTTDSELNDREEEEGLNTSDRAYQSGNTGAIVMLNSACRPRHLTDNESLRKLTDLLLLGTNEIQERREEVVTIDGAPALQTTLAGVLNEERVKLRTVVFRKEDCVYDMMYLARPEHFSDRLESFERFKASFRFR